MITNTTLNPVATPLTFETLKRMMDSLPPVETYIQSDWFANDRAIMIKGKREKFTCAEPDFWAKAVEAMRRTAGSTVGNPCV